MKRFLIWLFFVVLVGALASLFMDGMVKPETPKTMGKEQSNIEGVAPFVVLELFTSQGCSSCPSADKLLGEISAQYKGKPVYALSFHVDYWNYIGWKDPFSQPDFSARQRKYARKMDNENVYTPQLVVNGREGFVGSKREQAYEAVEKYAKILGQVQVNLSNLTKKSGQLSFEYQLAGELDNLVLNVALVEYGLVTKVKRGENTGRTIRNEGVVRHFQGFEQVPSQGKLSASIPPGIDLMKSALIVYVQEAERWTITGASSVELTSL